MRKGDDGKTGGMNLNVQKGKRGETGMKEDERKRSQQMRRTSSVETKRRRRTQLDPDSW